MLNVAAIKDLMDKLVETNLGELKIKGENFEIKIKAKTVTEMVAPTTSTAIAATAVVTEVKAPQVPSGNVVKSPIVGTFYASSAPDKPAFITVGKRVNKGDVLFVIESMKLMNEIQSEFDGEVMEILVDNAQGVEYGQPIVVIK